MRRFMNLAVVAVLVVGMLVQAPLAFAGEQDSGKIALEAKRDISGEEMVADLVFARPVGLLGLVFGTVAFVAALPFTIPTKQVEEAGKKLVVAPAKYTFVRPLGHK